MLGHWLFRMYSSVLSLPLDNIKNVLFIPANTVIHVHIVHVEVHVYTDYP